jgi:anti-anti-sigma regulatory factor
VLRIQRSANGETVLAVSGHLDSGNLDELKNLIDAEVKGLRIVLDLKELTIVDQEAVRFLKRCESTGVELRNCEPYIREWIARE